MTVSDDDYPYRARDLLKNLFTFYIGMAEIHLRERPGEELFFHNVAGLQEARKVVGELPDDDPILVKLDAWMREAGVVAWESRLSDGGWWSNLYYQCTRFRMFDETTEIRPFLEWIVNFYASLPSAGDVRADG